MNVHLQARFDASAAGVKTRVERAALELFAANGFDGVSIADIATAAGVSQGALYRHYASKDELAWTLFSTAYLRTGANLDMIRASRSGLDARVTAMVAHFCAAGRCDRRCRHRRRRRKAADAHRPGDGGRRHHGGHSADCHFSHLWPSHRLPFGSGAGLGARRHSRSQDARLMSKTGYQSRVESQMAIRDPVLTTALIRS